MTHNDITGDKIATKPSETYRDKFDDIFRPLCTDCGKRQAPGQIHTCTPKEPVNPGSSLMETSNVPNSE
jgi:hypothetical protein